MIPLAENALREIAKEDIGAVQPPDQLLVAFSGQIKSRGARSVSISHPIQPALEAIDPLRERFDVPVVTSNGASMRAALKELGLEGEGSLGGEGR